MRKTWIISLIFLVALVAAATAWLLTRPPEGAYADVGELVEDLEANGVECRDLTVSTKEQTEDLGGEFGFCFVGKKNVNIHVYEDEERVESHVAGNISVRGDNPNYFTSLVRGSNWVVDTYSEKTSRKVQAAIGGTIQ